MGLRGIPTVVTDWQSVEPVEHMGETGTSVWRVVEAGPVKVSLVDDSPGYRADHVYDALSMIPPPTTTSSR